MDAIPKDNILKVKVTTELWKNSDGKHLNIVTDICGEITKKVIALEEQATIDALIRLGWTPPDEALTALREYRDENARLRATISQVEYLIGKGLHEISAAYSPDDMSIAGRAEMQLALNVISREALKGKEE